MPGYEILIVDGDRRSLNILSVCLTRDGYNVITASDGLEALHKIEADTPALVIANTEIQGLSGFELLERARKGAAVSVPFIFLTAEPSVENKMRALELGVEDYLIKPVYIRDLVDRIGILLHLRGQTRVERDVTTGFIGNINDISIVDVLQTAGLNRKSGVLMCHGPHGKGSIYFRNGRVVDAELGVLKAERAFYRFLLWKEGVFRVTFEEIDRPAVMRLTGQALLMEGTRRAGEWGRLMSRLPGPGTILEVDAGRLLDRLGTIPDEANQALRMIDGHRSLIGLVDMIDEDELKLIGIIGDLYRDGVIYDVVPVDTGAAAAEKSVSELDAIDRSLDYALGLGPDKLPEAPPAEEPAPAQAPVPVPDAANPPEAEIPVEMAEPDDGALAVDDSKDKPSGLLDEMLTDVVHEQVESVQAAAPASEPDVVEPPSRPAEPETVQTGENGEIPEVIVAEEDVSEEGQAVQKTAGEPKYSKSISSARKPTKRRWIWLLLVFIVLAAAAGGYIFRTEIMDNVPCARQTVENAIAQINIWTGRDRVVEAPVPAPQAAEVAVVTVIEDAGEPPVDGGQDGDIDGDMDSGDDIGAADDTGVDTGADIGVDEVQQDGGHPAVPAQGAAGSGEAYAELVRRGVAHKESGRYDAALGAFRKALLINPKGWEANMMAGELLINIDHPDEAIKHLRTAAMLKPDQAAIFYHLGAAYRIMGRIENSNAAYRKYLAISPDGEFANEVKNILKVGSQ
ncbi:MAG: DUF4388 domain-containing protein [Myxococcota bacterium]|jgi:CheY-like chemotaxis protein